MASLTEIDNIIATLDTASFTYESVPLGLVMTVNNQYFRVPQGTDSDVAFVYYRNNNGTPLPVATLASGKYITEIKQQIQSLWDGGARNSEKINLFNKDASVDGFYIDTVGTISVNPKYFCSDKIPILAETSYVFRKSIAHLAFYNFNGKFLTYRSGINGEVPFTTPPDAYYLTFSQTLSTGKNSQVLLKGMEVPSVYIGYGTRDRASQDNRTHYQIMQALNHLQPTGINLFDKSRGYVGYALSTDGMLTENNNYFTTDYIPVLPHKLYISNKPSSVAVYYNADYERISTFTVTTNTPFLVPEGVVYMRFQQSPLSNADVLMVMAGESLPSSYVPFGNPTTKDLYVASVTNARQAVDLSQPTGRNIFDKKRAVVGRSISSVNGAISTTDNFFVTGLLPVTPGGYFVSSYGTNSLCWYDVTGRFLSGSSAFSASGNKPISVPEDAWYVQFQGSPAVRAESLMVTQGASIPEGYLPFGGSTSKLPWQNRNIIWLGDSMTYNSLYQPYVLSGTGMKQLANYGVPGQGVRTMADSLTKDNIADADFISIFGGTNDYSGNRPLGSLADARENYDESVNKSFYFDVFSILHKIFTLKPTVRVVFSTPLIRGRTVGQLYTYPAANGAGQHLEDYAQAIREVCARFAVPVCDLLTISGINLYNLSEYTQDNLHPNAAGSALHARAMIAAFNAT